MSAQLTVTRTDPAGDSTQVQVDAGTTVGQLFTDDRDVVVARVAGELRDLSHVLADGEDVVVFEYVKKSNRETGPALVGLDLASADGIGALVARMEASDLTIEKIPSGSPLFSFLL